MRKRMHGSVLAGNPEYVVVVKGPGGVVGEVSLDNTPSTHRFSARARDAVTVGGRQGWPRRCKRASMQNRAPPLGRNGAPLQRICLVRRSAA